MLTPPRIIRPSLILASALLLSSCGAALERGRAQRAFEDIHGCPSSEVRSGANGYTVEGCGLRAHFVCTGRDTDSPLMEGLLFGAADCIQDDVQHLGPRSRPTEVASVRVGRHEDGFPVLIGDIPVSVVRVRLLAAPTQRPDAAVVEMNMRGTVPADGSCPQRLWVDGDELPLSPVSLKEVDRRVLARARFDSSWLERLSGATRITGLLCDEAFVFSSGATAITRDFDIRFRELATAGEDVDALVSAGL